MVWPTRLSEGQMPASCDEYNPLFSPCVPYLVNLDFGIPSPRCCAGAAQVFGKANNPAAIQKLCTCLVVTMPNLSFKPQKLTQFSAACKIKLLFPIDKCIKA